MYKIARRETTKRLAMLGGLALIGFAPSPFRLALAAQTSKVTFVDVASAAGIQFRHDNAATAEKYLIETMGGGCGWIDYDQNGLFDLYVVNSAATKAYKPGKPLRAAQKTKKFGAGPANVSESVIDETSNEPAATVPATPTPFKTWAVASVRTTFCCSAVFGIKKLI